MKIAIVGAGGRTTTFLSYFSRYPNEGDIVGICDLIPEKAELLANLYGIKTQIFSDTEKMYSSVKPDAVIICTPDFAHVEPSVMALKQKIHVLCEKPMATTLDDFDTIIKAAKKSSAIFYLGFNLRHGPVHATIHDIVVSGRLGKITTIEANEYYYGGKTYFRRWNRLQKFGGGLWVTKACHDMDLLNWMAGAEPQSVYATANLSHYQPNPKAAQQCRHCKIQHECPDYFDIFAHQPNSWEELWKNVRMVTEKNGGEPADLCLFNAKKDTFDNGIAVVTYKNDIRATYTVNVLASRTTRQTRIIGTDGMVEADMERGTIEETQRHSGKKCVYDLREMMSSGHGGADDRMIKDFLHTCELGKKPTCSWAEGRLAVQVSLAARESCRQGKVMKL
jgi:predicted dehydrogenase